jgi:glucose-6-phosphate isomerase
MLGRKNPLQVSAWKKLKEHYKIMKTRHMRDLFSENSQRFSEFSLRFEDILVDYSKNIITRDTMELLLELASEINVKDALSQLFSGEKINETENRAVLHVALRNRSNTPVFVDNHDVMPDVNAVLTKIQESGKGIPENRLPISSTLASAAQTSVR